MQKAWLSMGGEMEDGEDKAADDNLGVKVNAEEQTKDEEEGKKQDGDEDEDSDDDDDISPNLCQHCLRVDFFDLGKTFDTCTCMFDCCRPFHYDEPDVEKLPLACQHFYYDTDRWKSCDDPCEYCTKTKYLGFHGQNECMHSCCDVDLDDVGDDDTQLSFRISASCHDWQKALIS